jgi:hypothetical protein
LVTLCTVWAGVGRKGATTLARVRSLQTIAMSHAADDMSHAGQRATACALPEQRHAAPAVRTSRHWRVALLAAACLALALPAAAQWKWRNAAGQTQYSDLPPPASVAEKDILARPSAARRAAPQAGVAVPAAPASAVVAAAPSPAASDPGAPKTAEPELDAKRRQAEQQQAAKIKADEVRLAAARAENCTRAKSQMRTLDSGVRIARTNEKGEREILDDKARAAEVKHAREAISANCS